MNYDPPPYASTNDITANEIDLTSAEAKLRLDIHSLEQTIKALEDAQTVTRETLNLEFTI